MPELKNRRSSRRLSMIENAHENRSNGARPSTRRSFSESSSSSSSSSNVPVNRHSLRSNHTARMEYSNPERIVILRLSSEKLKEALGMTADRSIIHQTPTARTVPSSSRPSAAPRSVPAQSNSKSKTSVASSVPSRSTGRNRKAIVSDDSDDEDSNLDLADDDDIEPSSGSEDEEDDVEAEEDDDEEDDEEEEEDEDAEGEPDDEMDVDVPVAKQYDVGDEDGEGEEDDEFPMTEPLGSAIKHKDGGVVPPLPIPAIVSPSPSSSEPEDEDEEEQEEEDEEDEEDDDEEMEDFAPSPMGDVSDVGGSRADTPDQSRLTKRQKGRSNELYTADLMELPDDFGSTKKNPPLTAAEQASRKSEMARRRKNQSEQKREEEKMETINKLLKKQAPKVNRRAGRAAFNGGDATPLELGDDGQPLPGQMPAEPIEPPMMIRWVSNKDGERLHVPNSWLEAPVGEVFQKQTEPWRRGLGKRPLIEEI